jgi:hypothetical protein
LSLIMICRWSNAIAFTSSSCQRWHSSDARWRSGDWLPQRARGGHRVAGNVFVICMLTVSAVGAYVGFMKAEAASRNRNMDARLECVSGCFGSRSYQYFLGMEVARGRIAVKDQSPAGAYCSARPGTCACAALRDLGTTTFGAISLAYVLRMVYRYSFILPGSTAGLSCVVTGVERSFDTSILAIGIAGFLAYPSSLHEYVPKGRMGGTSFGVVAAGTLTKIGKRPVCPYSSPIGAA